MLLNQKQNKKYDLSCILIALSLHFEYMFEKTKQHESLMWWSDVKKKAHAND